ncbi:TetR family transcriptional regulator [Sphaerisporangium siamense]|uniref:AcrR family transcriptional regulator n=1 Tax=Sphaerisporangium siamense TaxID=795645 RepID=A0A7W7G832_9ACTN|nr:TetR/AcrR family transcriptional regulator [Sphaerisporangium siamense]MBB4699100.1 AcrR family transcriptional regulator [Sphaerisporangium siamense]GII86773.1 TetR family transcriptional regulator [Sphaerisporangium siamense]
MSSTSRRQRVRDATLRELMAVSREILTTQGAEALTIRAVAREMGMTPPGIYRYFDSHRKLMDAVIVDILDELTEYIASATDEQDKSETARRLIAASRALRRWAVEHVPEFQLALVVATPEDDDAVVRQARAQVGALFGDIFLHVWHEYGTSATVPGIHPAASEALADRLLERLQIPLPSSEAAVAFTRCWLRLFGMVCVESLGLTRVIGDHSGALFEAELSDLARMLGLPESALEAGR